MVKKKKVYDAFYIIAFSDIMEKEIEDGLLRIVKPAKIESDKIFVKSSIEKKF